MHMILLLLALAPAATLAKPREAPPPTLAYPRVKKTFTDGLALIRRAIPAGSKDRTVLRARTLLDFHDRSVAWGERTSVKMEKGEETSRTIALDNSPADPAATIIVIAGAKAPDEINLRTEGTRLWLYEYETTAAWAGIMLLHELGHLDEALKISKEQNDEQWLADELAAYQLELKAADWLSEGRVTKALRKYISGIKATKPREFRAELEALPEATYHRLSEELTRATRSGPPMSQTERSLRYGFILAQTGILRFGPDQAAMLRWLEVLTGTYGTEGLKERFKEGGESRPPGP